MPLAVVVVLLVLMAGFVVYAASRFRHGGPGPIVKTPPLTRAGRLRMNRVWEKHGWPKRYDDNGDPIPPAGPKR